MPALLVLWQNKAVRIGLIIILAGLALWLWGRRAGLRKAKASSQEVDLPNNGTDIPNNWNPSNLANELYTVLDGIATWAATKEKVIVQLMGLTDGQLVAVYNRFNSLFSDRGKGTMTKWLRDEWNVSLNSKRDELVQRLVSLNCL